VIGRKTKPYDFVARDGEWKVGRIYRREGTVRSSPEWCWAMTAVGSEINRTDLICSGTVASKQAAAFMVESVYVRCLKRSG
jgi:hypothetical protein